MHFEHVCLCAFCEYIQVFLRVCWDVRLCACLQQVDTAIVQQVGGALWSLLQHLVLVDDLHCLVVNAQPAVEPNVEDIRGVVTTCRTVPMVIDNWLKQVRKKSGLKSRTLNYKHYNCLLELNSFVKSMVYSHHP